MKVHYSSNTPEWSTPPDLFAKLNASRVALAKVRGPLGSPAYFAAYSASRKAYRAS